MARPERDTATDSVPGEVKYAFPVLGFVSLVVVFDAVRHILSDGFAADVEAGIAAGGWPVTVSAVVMTGLVLLGVLATLQMQFAFLMRAGRNRARIALLVIAAAEVAYTVTTVARSLDRSLVGGGIDILACVIITAAVVAMFLPSANAHFRTTVHVR